MQEVILKAVEDVSNGVVISDPNKPDNPIIFVNKAFVDITGYSKEEVLGTNCRFLQGPDTDEQELQKLRKALKAKKPVRVILKNYTKSGKAFYNELYLTPQFDKKGKLQYFIGIQNDITQQIKAQQQSEKYKEFLKEEVRARTKDLSNTNKKLLDEIAQRQKAQEQILELNDRLRRYTQSIKQSNAKEHGPTLSAKQLDALKLMFLEDVQDSKARKTLSPSTMSSIRKKLLSTVIDVNIIPHYKYFQFITLVTYRDSNNPNLKKLLESTTCIFHAVCNPQAGFFLMANANWIEFKKEYEKIKLEAKKTTLHHSVHPDIFFDFLPFLTQDAPIHENQKETAVPVLDNTDKTVLWAWCKYPQANLQTLATRIPFSIPTIGKRKQRLAPFIKKYTPRLQTWAKYIMIGPRLPASHLGIDNTYVTLARDELDLISEATMTIEITKSTYIKWASDTAIKYLYLIAQRE